METVDTDKDALLWLHPALVLCPTCISEKVGIKNCTLIKNMG
jgi:hypothetical protein